MPTRVMSVGLSDAGNVAKFLALDRSRSRFTKRKLQEVQKQKERASSRTNISHCLAARKRLFTPRQVSAVFFYFFSHLATLGHPGAMAQYCGTARSKQTLTR